MIKKNVHRYALHNSPHTISLLDSQHNSHTGRNVDLNGVLEVVPSKILSILSGLLIHPIKTTKVRAVRTEDDTIVARLRHTNSVVCKALCGVEVDDEHQPSSLVGDHLVVLVLQLHVLATGEPFELLFEVVDGNVEVTEVLVAKEGVFGKVPSAACVVTAVVVACSWEINPFRVAKLIVKSKYFSSVCGKD